MVNWFNAISNGAKHIGKAARFINNVDNEYLGGHLKKAALNSVHSLAKRASRRYFNDENALNDIIDPAYKGAEAAINKQVKNTTFTGRGVPVGTSLRKTHPYTGPNYNNTSYA